MLPLVLPCLAAADSLDIARQLAQDGAPQLALARVMRDQPGRAELAPWWQWEVQRLALLDELGRNAEVIERLRTLPPGLPAEAGRQTGFWGARAALKQGEGSLTREYLSRLLWQSELAGAPYREARRLVAQSYLVERRPDEAYRVMLRYAQDFSPLPAGDAVLFTEGLLLAGAGAEAGTWLTALEDGSPLKLLARLRSGIITPEQAIAEARAALNPPAPPAAKAGGKKPAAPVSATKSFEPAGFWAVILHAAALREDLGLQVEAREHWQNSSAASDSRLFAANPDQLWQAYFDLAQRIGNETHLLFGEDATWFELGESLKERSTLQARVLFAYLSVHAAEPDLRDRARANLAASLFAANLPRTVVGLFAHNPKVSGEAPLTEQLSQALEPVAGQRESLLALGELAEKQGDAALAADYYLQAAHSGDEPAAGKARLQAARMLEQTGFAEDARRQYQRLLPPAGGRVPPR
jgi:hypothetical protein